MAYKNETKNWTYRYHKIFIEGHPELNLKQIPEGWCIHHKDFNHDNNDLDNLQLMTIHDHTALHSKGNTIWKGRKHTIETKLKISLKNKGVNNGKYGIKEDKAHAIERGKKITMGKLKTCTNDMLLDLKNGISRRQFVAKYGTEGIWNRYCKGMI